MQKETKRVLPIKGEIYYNLTLTGNYEFRGTQSGKRLYAEAQCVCGVVKSYPLRYLRTGNTKSCGCVRKEKLLASKITHHLSKHPLYKVHQDMVRRCYEPKCKSYKDYGARGIRVCDEWRNDVRVFCAWGDVNGYRKGLELDKKDNNANYSPENCRFVTRAQGNRNTRRVIVVECFGEKKCIAEWVRDSRCSIGEKSLKDRLMSGKWTVESAITTPSFERNSEFAKELSTSVKVTAWGQTKNIIDWSKDERCKIGYSGLKIRIQKGWDIEKAISTPPLRETNFNLNTLKS